MSAGELVFWPSVSAVIWTSNLYLATLNFHAGHWKLYGGAGIEDPDDTHHDKENVVRVGVEYAFEVGSFEIAPAVQRRFRGRRHRPGRRRGVCQGVLRRAWSGPGSGRDAHLAAYGQ